MPQYLGFHRRVQSSLTFVENPFESVISGCNQYVRVHPQRLYRADI